MMMAGKRQSSFDLTYQNVSLMFDVYLACKHLQLLPNYLDRLVKRIAQRGVAKENDVYVTRNRKTVVLKRRIEELLSSK
jgi:hypothetical protein